jgi:hypothetical protein
MTEPLNTGPENYALGQYWADAAAKAAQKAQGPGPEVALAYAAVAQAYATLAAASATALNALPNATAIQFRPWLEMAGAGFTPNPLEPAEHHVDDATDVAADRAAQAEVDAVLAEADQDAENHDPYEGMTNADVMSGEEMAEYDAAAEAYLDALDEAREDGYADGRADILYGTAEDPYDDGRSYDQNGNDL